MENLTEIREGRPISITAHQNPDPNAPVIFFVHGAGGRCDQFEVLYEDFLESCTLIVFDFLGHGNSAKPFHSASLYTTEELLADLEKIFENHKNKNGENILIGHSYGTCLAAKLQVRHPQNIKKLVLIGTCVNKPSGSSHMIWYLPSWILEWIRFMFRKPFRERAWHPHTLETNLALVDSEEVKSSSNSMFLMQSLCLGMQWVTREEFTAIGCPCLIIAGERDLLTPTGDIHILKSLIPDVRVEVIPLSGHFPMLENPVATKTIISSFIKEGDPNFQ
jgi:pimeloyl-ACP methyl ester carboxylesterase